jgi:hypothetical protein
METLHKRETSRNDNRACEHCGRQLPLATRRHARFCCSAHRAAHNRTRSVRFLSGATFDKSAAPYIGIVSDAKWPGMYRLKRADGSPSDMVNLTRARETLASFAAARRSQGRASGVLGAALDRLAAEAECAN